MVLGGSVGVREVGRGRGRGVVGGRMQLHISAKLLVSAPNGHFITWSWEKSHTGKPTRISQPLSLQHAWHRAAAVWGFYHRSASGPFPFVLQVCSPLRGVDPVPPYGKNGMQSIFRP